MSNEILNTELIPLEQWYCDGCGEIIEHPEDGMLEWKSFITENPNDITAKDFRIVHGDWIKSCKKVRYDGTDLSDGHLDWFLGNDGLGKLLTFFFENNLNPKELAIIIKRLQIRYYEEARTYIHLAHADDDHGIDPYDIGDINESDAVYLIRKYARR